MMLFFVMLINHQLTQEKRFTFNFLALLDLKNYQRSSEFRSMNFLLSTLSRSYNGSLNTHFSNIYFNNGISWKKKKVAYRCIHFYFIEKQLSIKLLYRKIHLKIILLIMISSDGRASEAIIWSIIFLRCIELHYRFCSPCSTFL